MRKYTAKKVIAIYQDEKSTDPMKKRIDDFFETVKHSMWLNGIVCPTAFQKASILCKSINRVPEV